MKEYCPYLSSFLNSTIEAADSNYDTPVSKYGHINQIIIDYLEGNSLEGLITDIQQIQKDYTTSKDLSNKLSDLGLRIDITNEYWGEVRRRKSIFRVYS